MRAPEHSHHGRKANAGEEWRPALTVTQLPCAKVQGDESVVAGSVALPPCVLLHSDSSFSAWGGCRKGLVRESPDIIFRASNAIQFQCHSIQHLTLCRASASLSAAQYSRAAVLLPSAGFEE
eukprot:755247-Hanusia_phi.AAC.2